MFNIQAIEVLLMRWAPTFWENAEWLSVSSRHCVTSHSKRAEQLWWTVQCEMNGYCKTCSKSTDLICRHILESAPYWHFSRNTVMCHKSLKPYCL